MKNRPARIARSTSRLLALAFLIASAITVSAQDRPPRPPTDRTDPARARFEETSRREMQLRNPATAPASTIDPKHLEAMKAQVEQDFERILTLHNEMVRAITASKPLDYHFVSDSTAEIKKRAARLQTVLALPKPDADTPRQEKAIAVSEAQMKEALTRLCRQIESFVKNPVIETPGTMNLQQWEKAGKDLESVIEHGDRIQKLMQRLKQAAR